MFCLRAQGSQLHMSCMPSLIAWENVLISQEESATRHEFFFSESHSMSDLMDKAADVLGVADKDFRPWLRKDATDEFQ